MDNRSNLRLNEIIFSDIKFTILVRWKKCKIYVQFVSASKRKGEATENRLRIVDLGRSLLPARRAEYLADKGDNAEGSRHKVTAM